METMSRLLQFKEVLITIGIHYLEGKSATFVDAFSVYFYLYMVLSCAWQEYRSSSLVNQELTRRAWYAIAEYIWFRIFGQQPTCA